MRHLLPSKLKAPIWSCPICNGRFNRVSPCAECISQLLPAPKNRNALYIYDKPARAMVHGIKYKNCLSPIAWIAQQYQERIAGKEVDVIAWIPASLSQKAKRGYDQCQLLAEAISYKINAPYFKIIKRLDDIPQTRKKTNRQEGPSLIATNKKHILLAVKNKKVLLIDDVITTGTSIRKGRLILKSCGVDSIQILAIAHTEKIW